jgi:hypothetical protein
MSMQMIELEEVMMTEVSDEAIEAAVTLASAARGAWSSLDPSSKCY